MKRLIPLASVRWLAPTRVLAAALALVLIVPVATAKKLDGNDGDGPEAQSALPINLDDLIEVAVRLSPDLARAKVDRSVAHDVAEGERRPQSWILSSSATYTRTALADHVDVPPFSVVAEDKIAGALGLGRKLPTGGELSVELGVQRSDSEYAVYNAALKMIGSGMGSGGPGDEFLSRNQASLRGRYKQPLMRGFGPGVALANEKRADLVSTEATIKAQLSAEEMIRDIVTGYWELAYASFAVDVRIQSLELASKQDQLTHEQMRAGAVPANSLNAVAYEIATRKDALLTAQLDLEQKSLELRRKAGLEIGKRDILMRPAEPFEIGNEDWNVDEILERSHSANRKLAAIQLERKIADVEIDVANDQTKPKIDLDISGALLGNGDNAGAALQGIGGNDGFEVSVGLTMQFELSGAARKARDAAVSKKRKLEIDRADVERQLDTQVVTSVRSVMSARARVGLADQAIAVADENVRAERSNFLVNRSSNFQVMQRQTELTDARMRRGRAIADYHVAVAQLQFLSGIVLEQYRVNVRPNSRAPGAR